MQPVRDRAALVLDLFDRYYDRTIAFLRGWTSADVAEELAQETFLRLLQHPEIEQREISVSYLLKVAHNLLRRRHARATRLRALLEARVAPSRAEHARGDAGVVDREVLEAALLLIGQDERDAIRLIVCEGLSYQQAADALGVSIATVNNWKHRGLAKLRRILTAPSVEVAAGLEDSDSSGTFATKPRSRAIPEPGDPTRNLSRETIAWRMRIDDVA